MVLTALFIANNTLGDTPITISFEQIEFNSGYVLTLGDGTSNNTDLSEYFAFYLSSNRNSYVDLTISSNCSDPVTLIINANQSGSGLGNMCKVLYNYTISSGTPIELNFDGTVPATIGKYDYYWNWTITAIPCNTSAYDANTVTQTTHHCCYVLYDEPQAPMDEPWIDVLDYACSWASGETSEYSIIVSITEGAYGNIGKEYYGGGTHAVFPNFNLTGLLADNWADCRDMSAVVQVFSNSLGIQGVQVRRIDGPFAYKPILPVGKTSWSSSIWNFHQVGYYSNVFDACLQLDQFSPRIPINEPINGSYKDDLFDSGYWSPNDATAYTNVY